MLTVLFWLAVLTAPVFLWAAAEAWLDGRWRFTREVRYLLRVSRVIAARASRRYRAVQPARYCEGCGDRAQITWAATSHWTRGGGVVLPGEQRCQQCGRVAPVVLGKDGLIRCACSLHVGGVWSGSVSERVGHA